MNLRRASWLVLGVVVVSTLLLGSIDDPPPQTNAERTAQLAGGFACPVCAGQSIAESDVPVAREIRRQIARWVDQGRSDGFIRDQLIAAYDSDIDYNPSGEGITALVWVLPLVVTGAAVAGLIAAFRNWYGISPPGSPRVSQRGSPRGSPRLAGRVAESPAPEQGSRRRFVTLAAVLAVLATALTAGLLVARFSGSRGVGESATGEIRRSARELVFDAQLAVSGGATGSGAPDLAEAIELYDAALELQPSNIEALTYRGWLSSRTGDHDTAVVYLDNAIASDPDYADAHLFRSIVALEQGDSRRAAAELLAFDALDPPAFAESLIAAAQLGERIAAAEQSRALQSVESVLAGDASRPFDETSLEVPEIVLAAEQLAGEGRLLAAVELLDWVLASRPDDTRALIGRGWLVARTGDDELLDRGIAYLDQALALDPDDPHGLVYRAFSLDRRGDTAAARADLAGFFAGPEQPRKLLRLIEAFDLAARLGLDSG